MTLREFTKKYLPLPDAKFEGEAPEWRKVFPTNLRWNKIVDKPSDKSYGWFGLGPTVYTEEESHKELEEKWERVHKGEIIDYEWRKIYTLIY